ncbi:hypothetical protein O0L34_g12030 [Tuta absoluta]|nr:hypothetical protein O0L34_g12030 [Tuta absoluta]
MLKPESSVPPSPSISEKSSVRSSSADSAHNRKPRAPKTSKVKNPKEVKAPKISTKPTDLAPSKVPQKPEVELASEIRLLRNDVSLLREDVAKLASAFQLIESRLNTLSDRITAQEERIAVVEEKTVEVANLKLVVSKLQDQLNVQSQSTLRSELEIIGIPETAAENPRHIILLAAAKVGVKVADADIDYTSRAGPVPHTSSNQGTPPRPLVVRFSRRGKRDEFYKAAKARRLTTADLEITGPAVKIFFNERLTRENRLLFRNCRNRAKNAGYKFAWTNGGTIFIKEREGRGSKPIIIRSTEDLDKAIGSANDQE